MVRQSPTSIISTEVCWGLEVVKTRVRSGLNATRVTGWLLVALCLVLIGFPLFFVIAQGFAPGIGLQREWSFNLGLILEIFERPLWRLSLYNSLVLATGAMFFGTLLGSALAYLTQTFKFRLSGLIDASAWILLVSPSFIISQGWVLLASHKFRCSHLSAAETAR